MGSWNGADSRYDEIEIHLADCRCIRCDAYLPDYMHGLPKKSYIRCLEDD